MCKACRASELGIRRQAAAVETRRAVREIGLNPGTSGFIIKYARTRMVPKDEHPETQARVERYNKALTALAHLHDDYVWELARQGALNAYARGARVTYKIFYRTVAPGQQGARGRVESFLFGNATHKDFTDFLLLSFPGIRPGCRYQGYIRVSNS